MKLSLLLAVPFATLACDSAINLKEPIEDRQSSKGRISIPLTTQASSGSLYQLHLPSVMLEDAEGILEMSFDTNDEFNISLEEGDYNLSIQDWMLYRVENGGMIPIESELVSENPQSVEINSGETTYAVIRFKTTNEVIEFDNGDLSIQIEVEEETPMEASEIECGEETYQDSVHFTDQEEFLQFATQYGSVQGTLTLEGEGIVDASALSCLRSRSITIENTLIDQILVAEQEGLHRLNILNNHFLSVISLPVQELAHLRVEGNDQLTVLQSDQTMGYGVDIQDNPVLQDINIASLQEIHSDLYIQYNDSLAQLDVSSLEYVGNRIRLVGNSLPQVMFPSLEATGSYVLIQDNVNLQSLIMPNIIVIGEPTNMGSQSADLLIQSNDHLSFLDLSSLFFISRNLNISNNPQLTSLNGFADVTSVQHLTVQGNALLHDVLGLSTLDEVSDLNISFNPHLPQVMVDYLYEVEIGTGSVNGVVKLLNNSSISLQAYDMSHCNAEYVAVERGAFYPLGSTIQMSFATSEECPTKEEYSDGTLWQINGECICE